MTWIQVIEYENSDGKLKKLYDRVKDKNGNVDNILKSHSLRPHTLEGHMVLYKNVLHNSSNKLPKYLLEMMGVYVSILNGCKYCVEHHYQGMKRLIADDAKSGKIRVALENGEPASILTGRELVLMNYAEALTRAPYDIIKSDIEKLRAEGLDDGEILEANQVVAYFSYANRTVLGLGIGLDGDIIGTSPNDSDDPDNWGHS